MPLDPSISRRSALRLLVATAALPPLIGGPALSAGADPGAGQGPLPDALRRLDKPGLTLTPAVTIENQAYRLEFHHAVWEGGATVVRDLFVGVDGTWVPVTSADRRFDEQWVVLTGPDAGTRHRYFDTMTPNWVGFDSVVQLDEETVELRSIAEGRYALTVRWSLAHDRPEAHWSLEASVADDYIVAYESFDTATEDDAVEVLCGALQHARVIGDQHSLAAWELWAPMALVQRRLDGLPGDGQATLGVYIPAEVMEFEHERELRSDGQPFGMSLRNDSDDVQPTIYRPHAGLLAHLEPGESVGYAFGLVAAAGALYDTYVDLCRGEYAYAAYRENVFDTSLTETVHNLVDLIRVQPDGDDSEEFLRSFSGWWSRAKGFVDPENEFSVRITTASVLLTAFYLTAHPDEADDFYDKRVRPTLEYQISRPTFSFTPVKEAPIYGNRTLWRLGGVSGDASTLVPMTRQLRGQAGGIHQLATDAVLARTTKAYRTSVSTPMQSYVLTGDSAHLTQLESEAERYARDEILTPYTTNSAESAFSYGYVKGWTEMVVAYELTGNPEILAGAHAEAARFITQTMVRPVPGGDVDAPTGHVISAQLDHWEGGALPEYPNTEVPSESVPAWVVATNGLTFEQLTTFKIGDSTRLDPPGGFTMIPGWAPFLLRLAHYTGDEMMAAVAHNLVIGRWTNYPGYYYRQFVAAHLKPDFPLQGPPGLTSLYFSHMPGQLGLTLDYLLSEHFVRSGGMVAFPREFETNYVFFKFSVYGHRPGTFYGEEGVWPYFPRGIVTLNNHRLNWLTGVGNDNLYLSVTNTSARVEAGVVTFDPDLSGVDARRDYEVDVIADGGAPRRRRVMRGRLPIQVSPHGITAVIVRGAGRPVPWQWQPGAVDRTSRSFHVEDTDPATGFGLSRAMLIPRPDRRGADAYVFIDTERPTTLEYYVNDGSFTSADQKPYPHEWTIRLPELTDTFTYRLVVGGVATDERTLTLAPVVTGVVPDGVPLAGEVDVREATTPAETVPVVVRVRGGAADIDAVTVTLVVPEGWVVGAPWEPLRVPAGSVRLLETTLTPPAGWAAGNLGIHPVGATATWVAGPDGGVLLDSAELAVIDPRRVADLTADKGVISGPGETIVLTATVLNAGPVEVRGYIRMSPPEGWPGKTGHTYVVEPRSEGRYTWTITAPPEARPGTTYRFRAIVDGVGFSDALVRVADRGVIVSNVDGEPGYAEVGDWRGSSLAGWGQHASRYSHLDYGDGSVATWTPTLPSAGEYEVAVWYPTNVETTAAATYVVHHAGGDETISVDQTSQANQWRVLGTWTFARGTSATVDLAVRTGGYHRASAVRFLAV
ncbi:golvesin C-terminal-like domain-containing protein [Occultella gossypii]|uniref:Golvesin/Xly CBD-like domain-containing protein n=1 Tax=Occultella gossypii TaxID=2800820 RepID=A0ABS7SD55_9MICO|nr:hypothetical protein [Occultella gossypii]MBZ2197183.1 hypothetical protein [Occultella gossypii]